MTAGYVPLHAMTPGRFDCVLTRPPPDWKAFNVSDLPLPPLDPVDIMGAWDAEPPHVHRCQGSAAIPAWVWDEIPQDTGGPPLADDQYDPCVRCGASIPLSDVNIVCEDPDRDSMLCLKCHPNIKRAYRCQEHKAYKVRKLDA
jgi:hypothetical protein